jgi:hypothetical protein
MEFQHPHLEVGEIFLQSHGLGRLHLLNHLEDLLDIFRAEAITAKSHHPAAVATLGDHEIAGVPWGIWNTKKQMYGEAKCVDVDVFMYII